MFVFRIVVWTSYCVNELTYGIHLHVLGYIDISSGFSLADIDWHRKHQVLRSQQSIIDQVPAILTFVYHQQFYYKWKSF